MNLLHWLPNPMSVADAGPVSMPDPRAEGLTLPGPAGIGVRGNDDVTVLETVPDLQEGNTTQGFAFRLIRWDDVSDPENPDTWQEVSYWRYVRFAELLHLPLEEREDPDILGKQHALMTGIYNAGMELIYIAAGLYEPQPMGVVQVYGAAGEAWDHRTARDLAIRGGHVIKASLHSAFPYSHLGNLDLPVAQAILHQLTSLEQVTTLLGYPDPRKSKKGMGKTQDGGLGHSDDEIASQQGEYLLRALGHLRRNFIFLVTAAAVRGTVVADGLINVARESSDYASRQRGGVSFGMSVGIPLVTGMSAGGGESFGASVGEGQNVGETWNQGWNEGANQGWNLGWNENESYTVNEGWTESLGVSEGVSEGWSQGWSEGVSEGWSQGWSEGVSEGASQGWSEGVSKGTSFGLSGGWSENIGRNAGENWGGNANVGWNEGWTDGENYGANWGENQNWGENYGENYGYNLGHNTGTSTGVSASGAVAPFGVGAELSGSKGWSGGRTYGSSEGNSLGWNFGEGLSNGESWGSSVGTSQGVSGGRGTSWGGSEGISWGESRNEGWSQGGNAGVNYSENYGRNQGWNYGINEGANQGRNQGINEGANQGANQGRNMSLGRSAGESLSRSAGASRGLSGGSSVGESWGKSASTGASQNVGRTAGVNRNLGTNMSTGLSPGFNIGRNWQTEDDVAIRMTEIYRGIQTVWNQMRVEGGFLTTAYLLTDLETLQAGIGALQQAFHGPAMPVPMLALHVNGQEEHEARRLRSLAQACLPSVELFRRDHDPTGTGYHPLYSTILPSHMAAAYTAPNVFEDGRTVTVQQKPPTTALYPQMEGEVRLGHFFSAEDGSLTNMPVFLERKRHFHTLVAGDTGFGKTVAMERLIYETTLKWNMRSVVFDFGAGWRKMLNAPGLEGRVQVLMLTGGTSPLRWNPLQVSRRIDPETHWRKFCEIFASVSGMGASRQMPEMRTILYGLYIRAGVLVDDPLVLEKDAEHPGGEGGLFGDQQAKVEQDLTAYRNDYWWRVVDAEEAALCGHPEGTALVDMPLPARQQLGRHRSRRVDVADLLFGVRQRVDGIKDPHVKGYLQGISARLETMVQGRAATLYRKGDDVPDICEIVPAHGGITVLEGGAQMDGTTKAFLLGWAGWQIFTDAVEARIARAETVDADLQLCFEEANKIFVPHGGSAQHQDSVQGESTSEQWEAMWRDSRKYGIYLHCVAQNPSALPPGIVSSSNNTMITQLKNQRDIDAMMSHLHRSAKGYQDEEWRRYIASIPRAEVVCKLAYTFNRRLLEPFRMQPLILDIPEPTDDEIPAILANWIAQGLMADPAAAPVAP